MSTSNKSGARHIWLHHPQRLPLRRFVFRLHVWCGICLGLYIFFISATGGILVYRNELLVAAMPQPPLSSQSGPALSDTELSARAQLQYPGYEITRFIRAEDAELAVEIGLRQGQETHLRYFDPRSGDDVGPVSWAKMNAVYTLMEAHKNFYAGDAGLVFNGIGAIALSLMVPSGLVIWWSGLGRWRQRLLVHRGNHWKRTIWESHSAIGIWSCAFIAMFALSGVYLCFQPFFIELADRLQPPDSDTAGIRFVDNAQYWLTFLHFGRINGISLACSGPGFCDQAFKAIWALFGFAPALMFITGATMWWNRVLVKWYQGTFKKDQSGDT